jgi:hypothetical protein
VERLKPKNGLLSRIPIAQTPEPRRGKLIKRITFEGFCEGAHPHGGKRSNSQSAATQFMSSQGSS